MVINRFFGVDPDGDHFDAMMRGDWGTHGTGRRRKPKKDYGEVPILYETDLVSEEDGEFDHEASASWSEKQVSTHAQLVISTSGPLVLCSLSLWPYPAKPKHPPSIAKPTANDPSSTTGPVPLRICQHQSCAINQIPLPTS